MKELSHSIDGEALHARPAAVMRFAENASWSSAIDQIASEEPLEIRIEHGRTGRRKVQSLSVTMRTPGHDAELAAGFLFTEGLIETRSEIKSIDLSSSATKRNTVRVRIAADTPLALSRLDRHFYTTSSCGICGKTSIEAIKLQSRYAAQLARSTGPRVNAEVVLSLPRLLGESQCGFAATGGLHAAGIVTIDGHVRFAFEDIGRHNALDKAIGAALLADSVPLEHAMIVVSGRAGFELVQKAAMAGAPILAAVGAPSSLALELARECNITLLGFLRERRFTAYHGSFRVEGSPEKSKLRQ